MKLCAENGVKVEVVPGPSAVVSALAISGLDTARFQFEGFLSTTKKQRLNHLASVKTAPIPSFSMKRPTSSSTL